jgi:hypothetical protein
MGFSPEQEKALLVLADREIALPALRQARNVRFTPAAPGDFPPDVGTTFAGFNSSGVAEYGTLVVPAEADVKSGEPYGAGGTEYTGSLVAGGGPLVGSGGLVG